MPAFDKTLAQREAQELHRFLLTRRNFATEEPGVIVVFCIVFIVAVLVIGLFINKKIQQRKLTK